MTNARDWKIGLSDVCCINYPMPEKFRLYAEHGIQCMEISRAYRQLFLDTDFGEIKKLMAQYPEVNVRSVHLPFGPSEKLNISTRDDNIVKASLEYYKAGIDRVASLGVNIAVIHSSGEPIKPEDREDLLEIASTNLAELAEYANAKNVTLAVEGIPRTCLGNCSKEIKKLISKHPDLRVCFDTNHITIEDNVKFIHELGDKIITLHVSDYNFVDERHWIPYEGKNDWVKIVTALEEVGYSGPWMYEIRFIAPETISRPRNLTFADMIENYRACIEKRPAPVIGTPIK